MSLEHIAGIVNAVRFDCAEFRVPWSFSVIRRFPAHPRHRLAATPVRFQKGAPQSRPSDDNSHFVVRRTNRAGTARVTPNRIHRHRLQVVQSPSSRTRDCHVAHTLALPTRELGFEHIPLLVDLYRVKVVQRLRSGPAHNAAVENSLAEASIRVQRPLP